MIVVKDLVKEFKVYKKYEGLSGAFKSLFTKEYKVIRAVDGISFEVSEGEIVGYIGVNGAGKSTTIKMLTGVLTPTSGVCTVNGIEPYKNHKLNAKNIGVVFGQRTQLWWDLPVSESFSILRKLYDIPKQRFAENLDFLKNLLDLKEFYNVPVRNLSLGQRMRAEFATAIIHNPKILFLDEPTIGLDIVVKQKLRKAIKELNAHQRTTVMLTTHDLSDIEELCNRIIVISKGKIIYDGSISDFKRKSGNYRLLTIRIAPGETIEAGMMAGMEKAIIKIETNEGEVSIQFDQDQINAHEIINRIAAHRKISDILIGEISMEDLVSKLYTEGQQQNEMNI
ncbi:MAG TPA: ATP-binding cassette domain-containing protein [Firmicutes bacterium]|nr:ATP-binding cassette domain-containing protein [Bacillota bacterium]